MRAKFDRQDGYVLLPAKYEVCPECEGSGTELGHGLKGLALSGEALEDDDFMQDYCSGALDRCCSYCDGRTTVSVMDVSHMTFSEKRQAVLVRRAQRAKMEAEAERHWRASLRERGIEY